MFFFRQKKYRKDEVLKLLVIRLSAMGDVAMTAPVVHSFVSTYPRVNLSVLSQKRYSPFFSGEVHFIGIELKYYEGLRGLYELFRILKKERFDVVLDLHDVLRSNVLRFFFRVIGIKVFVIDKGRKDKKAMTRRKNKVIRPLQTTVERYADVFERAGFKLMPQKMIFNPARVEFDVADSETKPETEIPDKIRALLPDDTNTVRIGVAPFAAFRGKIYPPEKMAEVLNYLSSKGFKIFLFGGDGERLQLQEWESKFPHCISIAGKFCLKDELLLMGQLDLMLSMDSANMHLASLQGIPVVSVWGATHPYTGFVGWGQSPEWIVQANTACRPCSVYGNRKCFRKDTPYACMYEVSSSMIIEKIMSLVDSIRKKP
jgi:ADP-heptose:LPS heptosyltransferase